MYRMKLVDKLQEKMARADQVKRNKEHVRDLYYHTAGAVKV